jgi:hypothetical protein
MQAPQVFLGCTIPTYTDKGLTSAQSRKIADACQSNVRKQLKFGPMSTLNDLKL